MNHWRRALARTGRAAFAQFATLLGASEINSQTWNELEELLLRADVGIATTTSVLESLQRFARTEGLMRAKQLRSRLQEELATRLQAQREPDLDAHPTIILVCGVNGSGKTTTIAKLAHRFQANGKKVLMGAADTFRAAGVDQLQVWGERLGVDVIAGAPESDPGAVAYNCVQAGVARGSDVILIDTAGRLHTRFNLMEELKKVQRVIAKACTGAPHEVWLVLDATAGQNALQQARVFKETVQLTGVILTKLDTSAHGGMVFAVRHDLGLPILFVGLGEQLEDLEPFDPQSFINGIFSIN